MASCPGVMEVDAPVTPALPLSSAVGATASSPPPHSTTASPSAEVMVIDPPSPLQHDAAAGIPGWVKEEVEKMNSTIDSEEMLGILCRRYGISDKDYRTFCNENGWGPCREIPNTICVFEGMLQAGVRFPLHDFYVKFLRRCGIAPSQLTPNAWRYLVAFVLLCEHVGVQPMVEVFLHYFRLHGKEGWYHVTPNPKSHLFKTDCSLPPNDGWKKRFFFLESRSPDLPLRCPEKWGTLNQAAISVRPDERKDAARDAILKLDSISMIQNRQIPHLELLNECRYGNELPVLPSLQAAVKAEGSDGAAASTPKRKYRSLSKITSPESLAIPTASSPQPQGFISPGSAAGSEHSTYASAMFAGALFKMQQTEEELADSKRQQLEDRAKYEADVDKLMKNLGTAKDKLAVAAAEKKEAAKLSKKLEAAEAKARKLEKELQAATAQLKVLEAQSQHTVAVRRVTEDREAKVRQLMDELQAEKDKSDAKARQLTHDLHAAKANHEAEVLQLGNELQAEKDERAAEVDAIRAECLHKVINMQHKCNIENVNKYAEGLRDMRDLTLCLYPGDVDPAKLTPEAILANSSSPVFPPPQAQAPADQ